MSIFHALRNVNVNDFSNNKIGSITYTETIICHEICKINNELSAKITTLTNPIINGLVPLNFIYPGTNEERLAASSRLHFGPNGWFNCKEQNIECFECDQCSYKM